MIPVFVKVGFNDPHAIVGVGVVRKFGELVDECAWVALVSDFEREEQVNSRDVDTPHSWHFRPGIEDDCVPSGGDNITRSPPWRTSDSFAIEAASAGGVAGCAEGGGC